MVTNKLTSQLAFNPSIIHQFHTSYPSLKQYEIIFCANWNIGFSSKISNLSIHSAIRTHCICINVQIVRVWMYFTMCQIPLTRANTPRNSRSCTNSCTSSNFERSTHFGNELQTQIDSSLWTSQVILIDQLIVFYKWYHNFPVKISSIILQSHNIIFHYSIANPIFIIRKIIF